MFDLTSSKLLILGIVALIVVGPKDLPVLLRTIGRYVGMLRRHANDFRSQFDAAMRESELASLHDEVAGLKRDVVSTVQSATRSLETETAGMSSSLENSIIPPLASLEPAPSASAPPPASVDELAAKPGAGTP